MDICNLLVFLKSSPTKTLDGKFSYLMKQEMWQGKKALVVQQGANVCYMYVGDYF